MAISETITVDAGEAIDSLNELAAAAEDVAGKFAGLDGTLKAGFAGAGAGPDKMIAAWDKAATSVSASVDKIGASIGKLDELGALAGAAGPADLVAKWDTAAAGSRAARIRSDSERISITRSSIARGPGASLPSSGSIRAHSPEGVNVVSFCEVSTVPVPDAVVPSE